ncbi:MAG TPA: alanyl-tRNA editing protein [Microthrixaceae bacterium]|nr:alanyl-tRNA editing protein [Microthrixaceae bacterium]
MPTELLYMRDAELREFDATVTAVDSGGSGGSRAALDRTAFYATGGGQPHDMGTLGGALVTNVRKESEDVWHTLDGDLPEVGEQVHGVLDWERRHQLMRTHSALHVLCGVIWNEWGKPVIGGNMEPLEAPHGLRVRSVARGLRGQGGRARQRRDRGRPLDRGVVPPA